MIRILWLALVTALLAGCGSGGGTTVTAVDPGSEPGTAMVELSTQAASGVNVIYAVEFVLYLPAGVMLADSEGEEVPAGVLQKIDKMDLVYLSATHTAQASVRVNIVDTGGFAVGNLATLRCLVSPGAQVGAAGFTLDGFLAKDANGAGIPVTPRLQVRTQ